MRSLIVATIVALGLTISAKCDASESIQKASITQLPYPAEVSLVQDSMGWTFLQSLSGLPLYLYEPDSQLKSGCNRACEQQWIPLLAPADEKPLGYWTILVRKDGRRQWAFEHQPVYTHLHATPDKPTGAGVYGAWHLMPHFRH